MFGHRALAMDIAIDSDQAPAETVREITTHRR